MADETLPRHEHSDFVILAGLTLAALVTRFYGLSEWPLIADEFFSFDDPRSRALSFANPANYALIALCFKLFGVSEWSARLPSVVFGIASIPLLALTWKQVLGRHTAVLAAIIAIFSSWHLWYSQFARFYAGVFLFGSLAYFLFYTALRSGRLAVLIAAVATNVIGFFFHVSFILVPISCVAFCAVVLVTTEQSSFSRRMARIYIAVHVLAAVVAVPFLFLLVGKSVQKDTGWGYGPAGFLLQTAKWEQIPIALTAVLGLTELWRHDRLKAAFFGLATGVPLVALVAAASFKSVRPDYLYYTFPLIILLSASLCVRLASRTLDLGPLAYSLAFLVVASLAPEFASHYSAKKSLDFRSAVRFVENGYESGDRIISFPSGFREYGAAGLEIEPYFAGTYQANVDWYEALAPYSSHDQRVWLLIEVNRSPLPPDLRRWLGEHTSLVWRQYEKRYDYSVRGYEIYLKKLDSNPTDSARLARPPRETVVPSSAALGGGGRPVSLSASVSELGGGT